METIIRFILMVVVTFVCIDVYHDVVYTDTKCNKVYVNGVKRYIECDVVNDDTITIDTIYVVFNK